VTTDHLPDPRWRSRGYIPHFEGTEAIQHVTFHLADSLPKSALDRIESELISLPEEKRPSERRKRLDAWIDSGYGSCVLRQPVVAEMVEQTLLRFDGKRYVLLAWVVMPNHVHAVFDPKAGWSTGGTVAAWKRVTARKILEYLKIPNEGIGGPKGPIWHREYWDRYARNEFHLQQMIQYVHQNPVAAGLVPSAERWPWSSARLAAI
jgi:REP element-mobilizing transposase RayT